MNKKSICLFLLIFLAIFGYVIGYIFMAWPTDSTYLISESRVLPVTAGKENFILPQTRLIETYVDLKNGEITVEEKAMPSIYIGMDRKELLSWIDEYMNNLSINELEKGLVSYELESYSVEKVAVKKQYYPNENFNRYFVCFKNGQIVIYYSDKKTVYDYLNTDITQLPIDLQCQIIQGMPVKDEIELYNFLQNYSS